MRITESTTKLKVTFVDSKEKSTAIGLSDSHRLPSGEFENFFWNCTCINQAKQVADTLSKNDFVIIGAADVHVKKNGKGGMLVFSMEKTTSPYEEKESSEAPLKEPEKAQEYEYSAGSCDGDDKPF